MERDALSDMSEIRGAELPSFQVLSHSSAVCHLVPGACFEDLKPLSKMSKHMQNGAGYGTQTGVMACPCLNLAPCWICSSF